MGFFCDTTIEVIRPCTILKQHHHDCFSSKEHIAIVFVRKNFIYSENRFLSQVVLTVLVVIWGLRLAVFLLMRYVILYQYILLEAQTHAPRWTMSSAILIYIFLRENLYCFMTSCDIV